jgi:hypothetical protein
MADPALVPQAVGQTLAVPERSGQAPVDALCIWLRDRRMLLLLDNCEHLVIGCAQLADVVLRRCTHLRVLATSREPLGVSGEVVWRVPSLRVPEAGAELDADRFSQVESVQLFEQRAMENLPGFQLTAEIATSVARICRQLDGIPLPIELAAARVRALSVEQIAERLTDRFELLNAGMRTAPTRQHTLQAAIEWSCALLTDPEQRLFDRLSVFAGGWTLEAAEVVCRDPVDLEPVSDLLVPRYAFRVARCGSPAWFAVFLAAIAAASAVANWAGRRRTRNAQRITRNSLCDHDLAEHPGVRTAVVGVRAGGVEGDLGRAAGGDVAGVEGAVGGGWRCGSPRQSWTHVSVVPAGTDARTGVNE